MDLETHLEFAGLNDQILHSGLECPPNESLANFVSAESLPRRALVSLIYFGADSRLDKSSSGLFGSQAVHDFPDLRGKPETPKIAPCFRAFARPISGEGSQRQFWHPEAGQISAQSLAPDFLANPFRARDADSGDEQKRRPRWAPLE